jgi:hypothetical protein
MAGSRPVISTSTVPIHDSLLPALTGSVRAPRDEEQAQEVIGGDNLAATVRLFRFGKHPCPLVTTHLLQYFARNKCAPVRHYKLRCR